MEALPWSQLWEYAWLWFKVACDDEAEVDVVDVRLVGDSGHVQIYGGVLGAVGHNSIRVMESVWVTIRLRIPLTS